MKLGQLYDLKRAIESDPFQEFFIKPLRKEQSNISNNFFSDSLKDAWRKGGRKEGIEEFFKRLKILNEEIKSLEHSDEG